MLTLHELPTGWLTEPEAETLSQLAAGQTVLELGAWKGRSTAALAATALHVVSVDWHYGDPDAGQEDTLDEYIANVRHLRNVTMVVGRFETVVPHLSGFDLVFLDGAHDYASVLRDAQLAIRVGRTIAFHDHNQAPVAAAVADAGLSPHTVIDSLAICN